MPTADHRCTDLWTMRHTLETHLSTSLQQQHCRHMSTIRFTLSPRPLPSVYQSCSQLSTTIVDVFAGQDAVVLSTNIGISVSTLMVVVLPAPLGPSKPKHSCLLMASDRPATATLGELPSLPLYTCKHHVVCYDHMLRLVPSTVHDNSSCV